MGIFDKIIISLTLVLLNKSQCTRPTKMILLAKKDDCTVDIVIRHCFKLWRNFYV